MKATKKQRAAIVQRLTRKAKNELDPNPPEDPDEAWKKEKELWEAAIKVDESAREAREALAEGPLDPDEDEDGEDDDEGDDEGDDDDAEDNWVAGGCPHKTSDAWERAIRRVNDGK